VLGAFIDLVLSWYYQVEISVNAQKLMPSGLQKIVVLLLAKKLLLIVKY
jgi:hypothetical protein